MYALAMTLSWASYRALIEVSVALGKSIIAQSQIRGYIVDRERGSYRSRFISYLVIKRARRKKSIASYVIHMQ